MKLDTIICGDNLKVLRGFEDSCVDMCVTSPPYYGLRDYGVDGQIGLEPSPEEYVAKLVAVFREVKRVLKDDGTLWLNLGDSYASAHPCDRRNVIGNGSPDEKMQRKSRLFNDLKEKDLIGIPWMVAFALRADGWWLRSEIIWHKTNCMPESVTDRPTKAHEQLFLLSISEKYFYDYDAILEPYTEPMNRWGGPQLKRETNKTQMLNEVKNVGNSSAFRAGRPMRPNENGRNKRSVWSIPTTTYKEAHFATFPPDLIEPCILAGSRVGGVVLDPFMGSGTTAQVSIDKGRHYIGIELNPDYCELARRRIVRTNVPLFVENPSVRLSVAQNRGDSDGGGGDRPVESSDQEAEL